MHGTLANVPAKVVESRRQPSTNITHPPQPQARPHPEAHPPASSPPATTSCCIFFPRIEFGMLSTQMQAYASFWYLPPLNCSCYFWFWGPRPPQGAPLHIMEMSSCCCSSSGSGSGVARFHKRVDLQPFNTSDDPEQQRDNEHERQPKTFRSVICNRPWRRHRDGAGAGAPQRSFPNPIQSAKPSPNPRASWKCSNVLVCQLIIAASEWKLPLEAAKA